MPGFNPPRLSRRAGANRLTTALGRGFLPRFVLLLVWLLVACPAMGLAHEQNPRVVRVGVDRNTPPMSYLDDDGVLRGFTPELLVAMEGINGLQFELVPGYWKQLTAAFEAGEIDVLANITIREERRETMDFTIQHSYVHGVTYTRPGDPPLTRTEQFHGKRMASLHESISDRNATAHGGWGAEIVHYPNWQETLAAVQRGECDFALIVRPLSYEQPDELGLQCNFVDDVRHPFHMAVHRGDRQLLENLNEALATLRHNGKTDRLFAKWIGPIGPRPIRAVDLRPYALPAAAVLSGMVLFMLWQRRVNRTLHASEEKYRVLVDTTTEGILVVQDGRLSFVNPALLQMTGLKADQMLGRSVFDFIPSAEQPLAKARQQELIGGRRAVNRQDYHVVLPDSRPLQLAVSSVPITWQGRPATLSVATDVTAVRLAEQAREEAAQRLAKIADRVPGVVYQFRLRTDGTTCFPYASEGIRQIYGVSPEQVRQDASQVYATLHPDDLDQVTESILVSARDLEPWHAEYRVRHADGDVCWVRGNAMPEREPDGAVLWHGYIHDVTKSKKAEIKLAVLEERFRKSVVYSPMPTMIHASDGVVLHLSDSWCQGTGYTREELATLDDWTRLAYGDKAAEVRKIIAGLYYPADKPVEGDFAITIKSGETRIWDFKSSYLGQLSDGRSLVISTAMDVTERRRSEEAMRETLREKEALLKEVHHRVKNNLQVITSLLRLEAARSGETKVREVLREMQGRIRSMALLHETVYRSENVARVNLAHYLRQLATQLFRAQNHAPERVRLTLDIASVTVELDQAIPCGLIVNELVTNSLKHGFVGERQGEVRVSLQPAGSGAVRLVVSDTGAGLPADFDPEKTDSLGLRLVTDLARQLGGEFQIAAGPSFTIIFKLRTVPRDSEPPFPASA